MPDRVQKSTTNYSIIKLVEKSVTDIVWDKGNSILESFQVFNRTFLRISSVPN